MTDRYEISAQRWAMIEAVFLLVNAWDVPDATTARCLTET